MAAVANSVLSSAWGRADSVRLRLALRMGLRADHPCMVGVRPHLFTLAQAVLHSRRCDMRYCSSWSNSWAEPVLEFHMYVALLIEYEGGAKSFAEGFDRAIVALDVQRVASAVLALAGMGNRRPG